MTLTLTLTLTLTVTLTVTTAMTVAVAQQEGVLAMGHEVLNTGGAQRIEPTVVERAQFR